MSLRLSAFNFWSLGDSGHDHFSCAEFPMAIGTNKSKKLIEGNMSDTAAVYEMENMETKSRKNITTLGNPSKIYAFTIEMLEINGEIERE